MQFGILGTLQVKDGERVIELARPKQRAVLAVLVIDAGRVVPLDRLIDLLWGGDPPAWATGALQVHVSGLRAALESDRPARSRTNIVATQAPGYLLRADPDDIDARRFEVLATRGHDLLGEAVPDAARDALVDALSLWRGPALAEFASEDFARAEASRLEHLRAAALEDRVEADLALGAAAGAAAELEVLVAEHPFRERLWGLLMLALYRAERQRDALRAYGRARTILAEELGVEPGPALRRLEEDILNHAPSLDWRPPGAPPDPFATSGSSAAGTRPATAAGRTAAAGRAAVPAGRIPLVGRTDELAVLAGSVEDVASGRGGVVLVSGEPGIGKTRLVEELMATAAGSGVSVSWGRCHEGDGAPSFWPWVQVMRSLFSSVDRETLREALAAGAGEIAQIAPEVKELVSVLEPPSLVDGPAARFRLYEAVHGFLARVAGGRPLAVVLDDLHWADVPTLELVEHVAGHAASAGVLLVVTFRDVDPAIGGPLASTLGVLARAPSLWRLPLAGLSEGECRAFIAATFGAEPSDAVAAAVHSRTDGNPFFVAELSRLMATDGSLGGGDHSGVPEGVRDVIRRRIVRLPARTTDLLATAAILDREIDLAVLAAAVRIEDDEALALLEAAVDVGILADDPEEAGRYRFTHALVQDTILSEIGLARRAKLHARVAAALRAVHGTGGARPIALAHHLYLATPVVRVEEAFAAVLEAADVAQRRLSHEQAGRQLERAVDLAARLEPGPERWQRELEVQHRLAALLSNTEGYHSPGVAQAWSRARELCAQLGDRPEVLSSLWGLARVTRTRAEFDASIELGRQLLDLSRTSPDASFAIAGHECCGFPALFMGDPAAAVEHLSRAVALSDQAALAADADAGSLVLFPAVTCRSYLACARWLLGDDDAAEQLSGEAFRMAERSGHPLTQAIALLYRAKLASMRDDPGLAEDMSGRCLAVAQSMPLGPLEAVAEVLEGWARGRQGDHDGGVAQIVRAVAALRTSGWRLALTYFLALQADVERAGGRPDRALATIDMALDVAGTTGERYYEAELCRLAYESALASGLGRQVAERWAGRGREVAAAQGAVAWHRRLPRGPERPPAPYVPS